MASPFTELPASKPASIDDLVLFDSNLGPWKTKSGGNMTVTAIFGHSILRKMLEVDQQELSLAPAVQLGLRSFQTSELATGTIGGKHFHRIKQEIIAIIKGSVEFVLEDVYGTKKIIKLTAPSNALCIPPFIMHTYTVIEPSELLGISNTLYVHDNPATHDTYLNETFQILKEHYKNSSK